MPALRRCCRPQAPRAWRAAYPSCASLLAPQSWAPGRRERGTTLIEVLVALFVFVVGLLAIAGLLVRSIAEVSEAEGRTAATMLVERLIARLRTDASNLTAYALNAGVAPCLAAVTVQPSGAGTPLAPTVPSLPSATASVAGTSAAVSPVATTAAVAAQALTATPTAQNVLTAWTEAVNSELPGAATLAQQVVVLPMGVVRVTVCWRLPRHNTVHRLTMTTQVH